MIFNWTSFGLFVMLAVGCVGAALGLLISLFTKGVLRWKAANPVYDSIAGFLGLLAGLGLAVESELYSIQVNGRIVRWAAGHTWWGLRPWVFGHEGTVVLGAFLSSVWLSIVIRGLWLRAKNGSA